MPTAAAPAGAGRAEALAHAWLNANPAPLGTSMGIAVEGVDAVTDSSSAILYYVVRLQPAGFVIVASDDHIEPVIAFSSAPYDPSPENPLTALLYNDMRSRLAYVEAATGSVAQTDASADKWNSLQSASGDPGTMSLTSVSDLRVAPLIQTTWDQEEAGDQYCYNYYTPSHYPTGCTATATAQLIRYHQHPTGGIGVHSFLISVDGYSQYWSTRGGNGSGGPYQWANMPFEPDGSTPPAERQAIGALCYDVGVAINTDYSWGGSSASAYDAAQSLVNTFGYSNAVFGSNNNSNIGSGLNAMVNPSLDAGLPVELSLRRTGGGHSVLADGYGYNSGTLYHHLNMGWGGADDAWYNLPLVDAWQTYTSVDGCLYNVFVSGSGEIVSGRVTDMSFNPLPEATVTAKIGSTVMVQTITNARGIYALVGLSSNTSFTVTASKSGHTFLSQNVTTGASSDWQAVSGNRWAINFASQNASPPVAYDKTVSTLSGTALSVQLDAADEGYPNPPAQLSYIVASLPLHGSLADPLAGSITYVPYTLASNGRNVTYTSCAYFAGTDTFTFCADDSGEAPSGGPSNTATISIDVDNHVNTTYEPTTNSYGAWPLDASWHDMRTQVIYPASAIGGAQTITDLALNIYQAPGQTLNSFTIRMKHTSQSYYSGTPQLETSEWTVCYQANIPPTPTGWRNFSFTTPFPYNGTQNLLVDFSFDNSYSTTTGNCFVSDTGLKRVVMVYSNSQHGSPLDWTIYTVGGYFTSNAVPNIKLISQVGAEPIAADFTMDCAVDSADFAALAAAWLTSAGHPAYDDIFDISPTNDNTINAADLDVFASSWLTTLSP